MASSRALVQRLCSASSSLRRRLSVCRFTQGVIAGDFSKTLIERMEVRGENHIVQLREHPIFVVLGPGFHWWPPVWARIGYGNPVYGEVGIFVGTKINEHLPDRLFLMMEHEGGLYMGVLVVKDRALCLQLCDVLQKHIGRTIKEIGDLEIDFFL